MSATTYAVDRRNVRPRGLALEVQRKVDKILAGAPRRERVKRIRAGLQTLIDAGEREWSRRRTASVGGGQDVPQLLVDVLAIATDFEALVAEDLR